MQKFYTSDFGLDVDRGHAVEPVKSTFAIKAQIRRAVEASGIGYTFVSSNYFAGYALPTLGQVGGPPTDKIVILGDGNPKGKPNYLQSTLSYMLHNAVKLCFYYCYHAHFLTIFVCW